MSEVAPWRSWPKVCRPRSGAVNTKAYRAMMVWQHPFANHRLEGGIQGWTALGSFPYAGPLRTAIQNWAVLWCDCDEDVGPHLVWRRQARG